MMTIHTQHYCESVRGKRRTLNRGALLIEALVALSILAILLLVSSQSILAGLYGAKSAGQKDNSITVLREMVETARAAIDESWLGLYSLVRSPAHYHVLQSAGKWVLFTGDETIEMNGVTFTRYFTVDDVSRNSLTRAIDTVYDPTHNDPSTLKVTFTVVWGNGNRISQVEYFSRWRNKVCVQSDWNTPGSTGVKNCPDTSFDASTDITAGASLKLTPLPP